MRSILVLFMLLASSILAVSSIPVREAARHRPAVVALKYPKHRVRLKYLKNGAASKHRGNRAALRNAPKELKPIVTLLDVKGSFLGGSSPEWEEQNFLSKTIFHQGFNDKAKLKPDDEADSDDEAKLEPEYKGGLIEGVKQLRIYFKISKYKHCTEDKPYFGFIAYSYDYKIVTNAEGVQEAKQNDPSGWVYVGITQGNLAHNSFMGELGRPVSDPDRPELLTKAMQEEWDRLVREFNEKFKAPR